MGCALAVDLPGSFGIRRAVLDVGAIHTEKDVAEGSGEDGESILFGVVHDVKNLVWANMILAVDHATTILEGRVNTLSIDAKVRTREPFRFDGDTQHSVFIVIRL